MKVLVALLLAFAIPCNAAQRLERLNDVMQAYVDEKKLAGAVTLIAKDGRIVQLRAHGFQDVESRTIMRTDSIFRMYSMTKPVTSAALLMLYEEGRFQLDDPLEKFIPEFADVKVSGDVAPDRKITVRDIFTHTGGISYGNGEHPLDVAYRKAGIDYGSQKLDVLVKRIAGMPLRQQPGTFWHYSYSHDIQAYLVEYFSGMPFDRYLQEKIFAPLGMTDTSFVLPPGKLSRFTSMYAPEGGYDGKQSFALDMIPGLQRIESAADSAYLRINRYPAGGSGLVSTANDYFRFAQMLVNGGALGGTRLLSSKTVELMRSPHVPAGFPGIPDMLRGSGYGLGVSVVVDPTAMGNLASEGQFGWSGAASTHVIMDPRENLVAILLVQYRPSLLALRKQFQTLVYQGLTDRK
jgi:CubicO group peptidase (beta-lactamase class C family)